jgi:hypothetical protein
MLSLNLQIDGENACLKEREREQKSKEETGVAVFKSRDCGCQQL